MAYVFQRWIASELREAGLKVVEVDGWENRGRPASTGSFDPDGPTTTHHTGSTTSPSNPMPTLRLLIAGRPDLPGPLSQVGTAHDGTVYVIAAGRCNHAGPIGKGGVLGMPVGWDGNALALGNEVDTNGTQGLPAAQRRAIAVVNAVFLRHKQKSAAWAHRHADISGSGKWDIGSLTTTQLRQDAADALEEIDMPTAQEIARAVWDEGLSVAGQQIRAGRVLVGAYKQSGDVAPKLNELEASVKALAAADADDATKQQAGRILEQVRAVRAAVEAEGEPMPSDPPPADQETPT